MSMTLQQKDWSQHKRSALSAAQVSEQLASMEGWALAERGDAGPDRVRALTEQRQAWEALIAKARER